MDSVNMYASCWLLTKLENIALLPLETTRPSSVDLESLEI